MYNHIAEVYHYKRFKVGNVDCNHAESGLSDIFKSCKIMPSGQSVLVYWAKSIGLNCPCKFIEKIPLILINNPYYFPKITYDDSIDVYDVLPEYPLVDYFKVCIADNLLNFVVVDSNIQEETDTNYFPIDSHEILNLKFGQIQSEDFEGNKESDFVLVFYVELSERKLKAFLDYMSDDRQVTVDDMGDIGPFIDAFSDDKKGE